MKTEPRCPYCGTEMILEYGHKSGMSYACPNCWSESPFVKYIDGGDTKALCYEAAMRRTHLAIEEPEKQKPLTMGQMFERIASGEYVATYEEEKDSDYIHTCLWNGKKAITDYGHRLETDLLLWNDYGRTWREWAARPTDEERAAAPWED